MKAKVFLLSTTYVLLLHIYTLTQFAILPEQLKGWCKARAWFNLELWLKIFLTSLIDCQKIILVTDVLWSVRRALLGRGCGWGRCCYWWCFQLFTQFVHPRCALDYCWVGAANTWHIWDFVHGRIWENVSSLSSFFHHQLEAPQFCEPLRVWTKI